MTIQSLDTYIHPFVVPPKKWADNEKYALAIVVFIVLWLLP